MSHFKLPIGYFLIDGLGSVERSKIVLQSLSKLHEVGVKIVSLTFDGSAPNLGMLRNLGCSFEPDNIKSHFSHPCTGQPVCVFLDSCHTLKLIKNVLGDLAKFVDSKGNGIEWKCINP